MKVKLNNVNGVYITGEYIKLDALLKFASLVSTGGEAKQRINNGEVYTGKEVCTSRGKKIRPGTIVRMGKEVILVKQK